MFNIFKSKVNKKILDDIDHKSIVKRYIEFSIGCLIVAIAFNLFLVDNDLVPGGVGGIAIILKKLFGLNPSVIILIADLLLLVLSYALLGRVTTRGSILGSILFPLFVEMTANIGNYIDIDTSQMLLSAVFGGVVYGFGAGLIFKAGFTTGGTDILNQIISKYAHISMGNSMLISDGAIVLASGFFFGATKLMYGIIILYLISYMADKVILGISDCKAFYIVTNKDDEIKEFILKYLNRGVTVFNAKGGYTKTRQNVLLCVLRTKEYYKLKEGINEIDPDAFFVVTDAYEVVGVE